MRAFLIAALLWAAPSLAQADVTFLGSYGWQLDDPAFGGFSGIEVSADGNAFIAISDRARIVEGSFLRDGDAIIGIAAGALTPLTHSDGRPLQGEGSDSEGLAVDADGNVYVSFEGGRPRIRVENAEGGEAVYLSDNDDFRQYPGNASLEALAVGPDGAIYATPERSGRYTRPFPVYRLIGTTWDVVFEIPRRDTFLISGADIGPDGLFYIVERDFTGIGFRTRVRRFALDGSRETVLLETGSGVHDNLEGISVWHDGTGIRLTMISDDNFRWFQSTQIVEYRVDD